MKKRILLCFLLLPIIASGQTYTKSTLYSFGASSTDGAHPYSGLVMDTAGNLYGTTYLGGGSTACTNGCGTAFKIDSKGKETVLHAFSNSDGANPYAGLAIDKSNNLYGMTQYGGLGYGTVFKITSAGKFSTLHQFGRVLNDGISPIGPVTLDSAGNLYGVTPYGGVSNAGTVFKVSSRGVETILFNFSGGTDGGYPTGNLLRDGKGDLYGTASAGGTNGYGVVFELSPQNSESVLYNFCSQSGCIDGSYPSYIVRSSQGNLYGEAAGSGIVYELTPQGIETPLYSFCLPGGIECADGGASYGPLLLSGGVLYGTGNENGTNQVAYELTTMGVETTLYEFGRFSGGTQPYGGVISDSAGNLYGTTYTGGNHGSGTVFKLKKD